MKSRLAIVAGLLCLALPMLADDDRPTLNIDLHSRVSFMNDRVGNEIRHDASGFKGDYFFLIANGQVDDHFALY